MNLSVEQKLAINMKVARDMWPDKVAAKFRRNHPEVFIGGSIFNIFDPDNTTDLNKAVEFYGIDVICNKLYDVWCAGQSVQPQLRANVGYPFIEKDRTEVVQQAVTAASGVNNDI